VIVPVSNTVFAVGTLDVSHQWFCSLYLMVITKTLQPLLQPRRRKTSAEKK